MIIRYVLEDGLPASAGNSGRTVNWEGGPAFTVANRKRIRAYWIHWGGKG